MKHFVVMSVWSDSLVLMYLYNFRCPSCLPWRVTSTCVYTARVTPTYSTKDFWCVREIIASYCSQVRFDTFCSYTVFISLYNFFYSPHQTMFEDVSGFGAWQRLFFKLEGGVLYYWNYPNEMGSKVGNGTALIWQIVLKKLSEIQLSVLFLISPLLFIVPLSASRGQHLSVWLWQCEACGEGLLRSASHLWTGEL